MAIKCLEKADLAEKNIMHQLKRELEIHCRLRHPNIIRLYGYFHDASKTYMLLITNVISAGSNIINFKIFLIRVLKVI